MLGFLPLDAGIAAASKIVDLVQSADERRKGIVRNPPPVQAPQPSVTAPPRVIYRDVPRPVPQGEKMAYYVATAATAIVGALLIGNLLKK